MWQPDLGSSLVVCAFEWIRDGAIHQPQHPISQPTEGAMCWLYLKTGCP
jgi:hypothetical protein